MTFYESAQRHIASRGSPGTREQYGRDLDRWLAFCADERFTSDPPTLEAATAYRDRITERHEPATVRRILAALSSMYDAHGGYNPFKSSKHLARPPADETGTTKELSETQALAIIEAALKGEDKIGLRDATIMQLLYDTGLRVDEIVTFRVANIFDEAGKRVVVHKVKKKGRVKSVIPAKSADMIDLWLAARESDSEWLFPALRGRGHLSRSAMHKRIQMYGARVGIKDAHAHRFRVAFITSALDAGIPLHEVQGAVHHSDPKTTKRYDRHDRGAGVSTALADWRSKKQ